MFQYTNGRDLKYSNVLHAGLIEHCRDLLEGTHVKKQETFQVLLASRAVKAPFSPFPGTDQLTVITTGGQLKYVRTSSYPP